MIEFEKYIDTHKLPTGVLHQDRLPLVGYCACGLDLAADLPAVRPRPDLQRRHQESGQDPGAGLMWG